MYPHKKHKYSHTFPFCFCFLYTHMRAMIIAATSIIHVGIATHKYMYVAGTPVPVDG